MERKSAYMMGLLIICNIYMKTNIPFIFCMLSSHVLQIYIFILCVNISHNALEKQIVEFKKFHFRSSQTILAGKHASLRLSFLSSRPMPISSHVVSKPTYPKSNCFIPNMFLFQYFLFLFLLMVSFNHLDLCVLVYHCPHSQNLSFFNLLNEYSQKKFPVIHPLSYISTVNSLAALIQFLLTFNGSWSN